MLLNLSYQLLRNFINNCTYSSAPRNLDKSTTITIDGRSFIVEADDLEKICDLGRGAYGIVEKMRHRQTGTVMAVKRITATVNSQEQVNSLDISSTEYIYILYSYLLV